MENKQTAIEWLWQWIMKNPLGSFDDGVKAYNQAKQMEKDQIEMAHYHNRCIYDQSYDCTMKAFFDAQEYYEQNYGELNQ